MLDFYRTQGGRAFIDGTVPRLISVLERIATAVEKSNELREREFELQVAEVPPPKVQTCDVEGCSNVAEMCCNECDVVVCSDHWESADEAGCHCHPKVGERIADALEKAESHEATSKDPSPEVALLKDLADWRGAFDDSPLWARERAEERFHAETGLFAPGRDILVAMAGGPDDDEETRRRAWRDWTKAKNAALNERIRRVLEGDGDDFDYDPRDDETPGLDT